MKRFSWLVFALATVLHLYGTSMLFDASMRESHLNYQGPQHTLALGAWAWVWLPVPMLLKPLLMHQGPPSDEWPIKSEFPWMIVVALSWSFVVGAICGFVDPTLSRWRRRKA